MQSVLGILFAILVAYLMSSQRGHIGWRFVVTGFLCHVLVTIAFVKVPFISGFLALFNKAIASIETSTGAGTEFVFGYLAGEEYRLTLLTQASYSYLRLTFCLRY